jgi:hypothetical protein
MTIGISIALNGHTPAVGAVLRHYAGLALPGVVLHAIGSSPEDEEAATESGWLYDYAPNDNLGAKRNAGLAALRGAGVAAVIRIGADDILAAPLLSRMLEALRGGARGVIVRGSFVQDGPGGEVIELYRTDYALGIGAPVLETYGWALYEEGGRLAPDRMISAYVAGRDATMIRSTAEAPFLQIKSAGAINTFERIKKNEIWRPASLPVIAEPEPEPPKRKRKAKPAESDNEADGGETE